MSAYDDYDSSEYDAEIASQTLEEEGLQFALEQRGEEVQQAVEQWQADEWLEQSCDWVELVNLISRHDQEQLRKSVRYRAASGERPVPQGTNSDLELFNLASDISKLLEARSTRWLGASPNTETNQTSVANLLNESVRYGHSLEPPQSPFAQYAQYCTVGDDLDWVSDLVRVTRAFRDILFAIADPQQEPLRGWEVSKHIRTIDAALEKGTRSRLVYSLLEGKHYKFRRESNPGTTPLVSLLADWICEYLVLYLDRIDLGACVECGKIFPRQRRDNTYCSKTCQNRVAYKRKKIFETGVLQKIEVTHKTAAEKAQPGIWVSHPRLGLGIIEAVEAKPETIPGIIVRFPQASRTLRLWELFQSKADATKIEFYKATDATALSELL